MRIRKRRVVKTIEDIIDILKKRKLRKQEIILVLGQVLIQVGYTIYYKIDRPEKEPPGKMDGGTARKLEKDDPTLGSMLIRLGFDFQVGLLQSIKESEERNLGKNKWTKTEERFH